MAYDPTIVLSFGARVRMTSHDPYGLNGRELCPSKADIGFTGVIVSNAVETDGDVAIDVAPGTATPEESYIMYTVLAPDGRRLELASYEVEPV